MKMIKNLFLVLMLATAMSFAACETQPDDTGSASLGVSMQALSADDVDNVTITVSGDNINPDIVRNLHFSQGQWKGIIGGIPAGTDRTFFAQAFDSQDALIYEGEVTGVEIIQGGKASVIILLQQKNAPDPFENTAPTIDSILASSTEVSPDDPVDLVVAASDVDPGDTLTYAWTATDGAFDDAALETPVWTAPGTEGVYTLTIEVTDSKNAKRAINLDVDVRIYHGRGRAAVNVDFNTWPEVAEVNADPTRLNINETTNLTVDASDNDGDTLSYAWVDNSGECAGSFNDANAQNPTWTAPGTLPGAGVCILTVTVTDGRGGTNTGELTINLGEEEDPNIAPVFEDTYQSSEEAADTEVVYFDVTASDADGDTMNFQWTITIGTGILGNQDGAADFSSIEYTSDGNGAVITAKVTDANGAYATQTFIVNGGVIPALAIKIAAGGFHSCGIRTDSTAQCWGRDNYGQSTPPGGVEFTQITVGRSHTCGLKTDGIVECWGFDSGGQLNVPSGVEFAQISAGGFHTCGVKSDGIVRCWGSDNSGQSSPPSGVEFTQIETGGAYTCGVKADGTAQCWGSDEYGQSSPPSGVEFTQITAGGYHVCGIKTDGIVQCWGRDDDGQSTSPSGVEFTQIASGTSHSCGIKADGTAECWGLNGDGQSTPPGGVEFTQIDSGTSHSCGLKTDGIAECWGSDGDGQSTVPVDFPE